MIKKIFISLLSIVGFGISFTSAYSCNYNVTNYFCNYYLNFGQSDTSNMYFGGSVKDNKFNFYGGANYVFRFNIPLNGVSFNALTYYRAKDGLHYTSRYAEKEEQYNGKIDGFYVCSTRPGNSYAHLDRKDFCVYHNGFDDFGQYISNSSTYVFACNRGFPNNLQSKDVNCVVCVCDGNCDVGKQHVCIDKSKTSENKQGFITTAEITLQKLAGENPILNPDYYKYIPNDAQNVETCQTVQQIMNNMGEKYNTGLCYNSTMYYDGNTIQQTTKEDIFTIFGNKTTYTNRINIFKNNCQIPATQESCKNAFSGEFKKQSIIGNAINNEINTEELRTYCDLGLNHEPNEEICKPTSAIDYLRQMYMGNMNMKKPATGTVYDELNIEENKYDPTDIRGNIESVYNKITGIFKNREGGQQGIIPEIIIRMMFIIILFTVIFKW